MAHILGSMTPTERTDQSRAVEDLVLASDFWRKAQSLSIYVSMDQGEVYTDALCQAALAQGTF